MPNPQSAIDRRQELQDFLMIVKAVVNQRCGKHNPPPEDMRMMMKGIVVDLYYAGYGKFIQNLMVDDVKKIDPKLSLEGHLKLLLAQPDEVLGEIMAHLIHRFIDAKLG